MRQFDVFTNPVPALRKVRPYLLLVQSAAMGPRNRRVFMPLMTRQIVDDVPRLMPKVEVSNQTLWFAPFDPVVLPLDRVGNSLANLAGDRDRLLAAIDLVFTGV